MTHRQMRHSLCSQKLMDDKTTTNSINFFFFFRKKPLWKTQKSDPSVANTVGNSMRQACCLDKSPQTVAFISSIYLLWSRLCCSLQSQGPMSTDGPSTNRSVAKDQAHITWPHRDTLSLGIPTGNRVVREINTPALQQNILLKGEMHGALKSSQNIEDFGCPYSDALGNSFIFYIPENVFSSKFLEDLYFLFSHPVYSIASQNKIILLNIAQWDHPRLPSQNIWGLGTIFKITFSIILIHNRIISPQEEIMAILFFSQELFQNRPGSTRERYNVKWRNQKIIQFNYIFQQCILFILKVGFSVLALRGECVRLSFPK